MEMMEIIERPRQREEGINKMYPKVTGCDIIDLVQLVPNTA